MEIGPKGNRDWHPLKHQGPGKEVVLFTTEEDNPVLGCHTLWSKNIEGSTVQRVDTFNKLGLTFTATTREIRKRGTPQEMLSFIITQDEENLIRMVAVQDGEVSLVHYLAMKNGLLGLGQASLISRYCQHKFIMGLGFRYLHPETGRTQAIMTCPQLLDSQTVSYQKLVNDQIRETWETRPHAIVEIDNKLCGESYPTSDDSQFCFDIWLAEDGRQRLEDPLDALDLSVPSFCQDLDPVKSRLAILAEDRSQPHWEELQQILQRNFLLNYVTPHTVVPA